MHTANQSYVQFCRGHPHESIPGKLAGIWACGRVFCLGLPTHLVQELHVITSLKQLLVFSYRSYILFEFMNRKKTLDDRKFNV